MLNRMTFELTDVELVVDAPLLQQLPMRPPFDDPAVINHQHQIGIADGAQAVGDDKTRLSFHEAQKRLLNSFFGTGIDAAGGFIKNEDGGVGENGPGDGQQLPLALAEVAGSFR